MVDKKAYYDDGITNNFIKLLQIPITCSLPMTMMLSFGNKVKKRTRMMFPWQPPLIKHSYLQY